MSKKGSKGALFWTSYSDLMTTLFFVMLVLFIVVTIAMGRIVQNNKTIVDEYNRVKERIRSRSYSGNTSAKYAFICSGVDFGERPSLPPV